MKKLILGAITLTFTMVVPLGSANATYGEVFAENSTMGAAYLTLNSTATRAQTFTAGVAHLMRFDAYLKDRVQGSFIRAYLINEPTQEIMEESGHRMDGGDGWEEFSFDSALDKESVYRVKILVPDASDVKWMRSGDNYAGGMMYYGVNTFDLTSDMNFKAWGYDEAPAPVSEENPPANNTASNNQSGQSANNGVGPATTTSASIKAPTNLAAEYADSAVKLTWTKSATADIDGYKVFRSESKTTGFKEIGKTVKATVEYNDKDLVAGTTYYYMVRAYKTTAESASTSTALIKIPEVATVAADTVKKVAPIFFDNSDTTDWTMIALYWILGGVIGILIVLLIAYEKERARKVPVFSGRHFRLSK